MKNTRKKLVMLLAIFGVALITLNFLPGFHKSEIYIVSNNEVNEWLIKPDGSNIAVDELFAVPPTNNATSFRDDSQWKFSRYFL